MQPNYPQRGLAEQHDQPFAAVGEPYGGQRPFPGRPKPKANAGAAATAGILSLLTAGMLVWFALDNVGLASDSPNGWSSLDRTNILGGFMAAACLVIAAAFTFARKIVGVWVLCFLAALFAVMIVISPLLRGLDFGAHLDFVFGFEKSNGIAIGLADFLSLLTAIAAAFAGGMKSSVAPAGG